MKSKHLIAGLLFLLPSLFIANHAIADAPFIGEMRYFAGNFAPRGWAFCDGQLLPISQNTALFSLLGTMYGGDGRTTFALPDMRGRALIHSGNGPGLTPVTQGSKSGSETVTMTVAQMPSHNHALLANGTAADTATPNGNAIAAEKIYKAGQPADKTLHTESIANSGAAQAIDTVQPYIALNCIIALQGIFPSRN
ncbi:Microcystin-dependent protein [Colwellia chukchiensis]|uniref:Microcystin-dependent protein n=1 Tax=Colwellia chukchiensis TaxID=641665 RepID=A0A1H7KPY8_9GAMM|nr:tail fiber protein [Colwellia chukchiensis]SEK88590.1 Microcystin-dependent protein [Colwellia chukchiensis]